MSMSASTSKGAANAAAPVRAKALPMIPKLAYRNLFHDRLSLAVTLVGIVFSVVLVAVQCGLYLGSENRIAAMLDHTQAELWVAPLATKSFDDPALLPGREKHAILSTPGVAGVEEMVVGYVNWRKPTGGITAAVLVGIEVTPNGPLPWDVIEGSAPALAAPMAVAIDSTYFEELGIKKIGDTAEINFQAVNVSTVTKGIRGFTTLPYIFCSLTTARSLLDAAPNQSSYVMVRLAKGADVDAVKKALSFRMQDADVLTHAEFRDRSVEQWMFSTGAGAALIGGALLGIIVGIVVVAQTLYASTKDHLNEFATLRALGASSGYIVKVILMQAVMSAVIGYMLGMALSLAVIQGSREVPAVLIVMTPKLALGLLVLTVGMCILAALGAIFKVTRIDPAVVFSR